MLAFAIGAYSATNEIQLFCIANVVAMFFDLLYTVVLYVPVLVICARCEKRLEGPDTRHTFHKVRILCQSCCTPERTVLAVSLDQIRCRALLRGEMFKQLRHEFDVNLEIPMRNKLIFAGIRGCPLDLWRNLNIVKRNDDFLWHSSSRTEALCLILLKSTKICYLIIASLPRPDGILLDLGMTSEIGTEYEIAAEICKH